MALPASVRITDVALRDGLQIQPRTLSTDTKIGLLEAMLAAGIRSVEAGSFVNPRLVPQMADADVLFGRLPHDDEGLEFIALVPNMRGAERALAAGVTHARLLLSCTEGHSRANTNRSVDEGIAEAGAVLERLRAAGLQVTGAIATVFICPFDGVPPLAQVERVVGALVEQGLTEISLSDTLGKADPAHVARIVAAMRSAYPETTFGLHLHNTYGMGLANVAAGLDQGITQFDAALGGIGGCPFAPGAAGNIATEDVVFMLDSMGVETGIDLVRLAEAGAVLRAALDSPLESAVSRALGWAA
jgi:hydroxymethylglutaryl-CoA lyase